MDGLTAEETHNQEWMTRFLDHLRMYSTDETPIYAPLQRMLHVHGVPYTYVYNVSLAWRPGDYHTWYVPKWSEIVDPTEVADLYGREGQHWYRWRPRHAEFWWQHPGYAWPFARMRDAWDVYKKTQARRVKLYLNAPVPRVLSPDERLAKEHNKRKRRVKDLASGVVRGRKRQKTDTTPTTPIVRDQILPKELVALVVEYL
jgi:hypothetical protein